MVLYAQTKVEGTVYDDMGPAIGVNVTVPGTTLGTITDFDGHFELSVPSDAKTIRFSYVGYQVQELPIKAHMKVTLKAETQEIQEVVVTGIFKKAREVATSRFIARKISSRISGVKILSLKV